VARRTTKDVTIDGFVIPAGTQVTCLGGANTEDDDAIKGTGDRRSRQRLWGFGAGPHACPGAHLTRTALTVPSTNG
jgi:cytochrome P450